MKPLVFYAGAPHGKNEDEDPDSRSRGNEWDLNISEDDCSNNSEENLLVDGHNSETVSDTESEEPVLVVHCGILLLHHKDRFHSQERNNF